jgi:hypothetical protein
MIHSNAERTAGYTNAAQDQDRSDNETEANVNGMENHKNAAEHFAKAAEMHYQAARYHGEGNHIQAHACALKAAGHASLARKFQRLDSELFATEQ